MSLEDIQAAAKRLSPVAVRTPLLSSPAIDRLTGARLLVKAEALQRTGSFKFRGAYNALGRLTPDQRRRGVVAYSSGNHAQGVAAAAELLGIPAIVLMPSDAPTLKIDNTRSYGAEIRFYDRATDRREVLAAAIAADCGATLIPPYDHADVIAGQGTIGLEMVEQTASLGLSLDAAVICCGGGGLTAGIAIALASQSPHTLVYTAEPASFDDTARSVAAGRRLGNQPGNFSLCDSLMTEQPGELTFEITRNLVQQGLVATDREVERAMALAFDHLKLVIEPGGAAALAAFLAHQSRFAGKVVAVTASGGNVDRSTFIACLSRAQAT